MRSIFAESNKKIVFSFFIPLLLFCINFITKVAFIESRDIALDEPFSIYYAQMDIQGIIDMLYNENNPPFHFFLLHYWIKMFGLGAFSVRFPSLIFSCFTAVMVYKIGTKFFNVLAGTGAALIFTFSTMHVFFSHEARVYPLFVLLTAVSLYYYLSISIAPDIKRYYVALFFTNLVLIYSHYFGFFVLFVEVVCLFVLPNRKELLKKFFVLFLCLGIFYIPNLLIFWHRFSTSAKNGTWVAIPAITEYYGNLNRFLNNRYNMIMLLIAGTCIFIYLYRNNALGLKLKQLFRNTAVRIVFLWFFVPYTLMFLLSFKVPMFIDRYILYTSVPFYLLIAVVLVFLQDKVNYQLLALNTLLFSMILTLQLNPDNNRRLKEVTEVVKRLKKSSTVTLLAPEYAYMGFAYHYNIDSFKKAPQTVAELNKERIYPVSIAEHAAKVLPDSPAADCIYIQADTEFSDPQNLIYSAIAKKYKFHKEYKVFQIYLIHHFYN